MLSSPTESLLKYGIIGAFDSVAMMHDEDTALILSTAGGDLSDRITRSDEYDEEVPDDDDILITYFELQLSSEDLAAQLYHRHGVRCGNRVVLLTQGHAAAEVTACLACLRIGAPLVPVDHSWISTGDRFGTIVADACPVAAIVVGDKDSDPNILSLAKGGLYRYVLINPDGTLVATEANSADIPKDIPPLIDVVNEDDMPEIDRLNEETLDALPPLYVLYTSGSTGIPKGVLGTHKGLINRLVWQYRRFPFLSRSFGGYDDENPGEVICRRTPLTFVDAIVEIFAPLLAAVPIWVPPAGLIREGGLMAIAPLAATAGVSRVTLLPCQLAAALRELPNIADIWPSLKFVVVSGEPCLPSLVRQFAAAIPHGYLINLYGSTEIAGDVSYAVLSTPTEEECNNDLGYFGGELDGEALASTNNKQTISPSSSTMEQEAESNIEEDYDMGVESEMSSSTKLQQQQSSTTDAKGGTYGTPVEEIETNSLMQPTRARKSEGVFLLSSSSTQPTGNSSSMESLRYGMYQYAPIGIPIDGNELLVAAEIVSPSEQVATSLGYPSLQRQHTANEINDSSGRLEKGCGAEVMFRLVPDDVAGELLVSGAHVAQGYFNRPAETAQRFIHAAIVESWEEPSSSSTPALFSADSLPSSTSSLEQHRQIMPPNETSTVVHKKMVFRTGDIVVRRRVDGALVWLGRRDNQVKIRGVRIELEEAERSIAEALGVTEGIAVLATDLKVPSSRTSLADWTNKSTATIDVGNTSSVSLSSSSSSSGTGTNEMATTTSAVDLQLVLFVEIRLLQILNSAGQTATSGGFQSVAEVRRRLNDRILPIFVPSLVLLVDSLPRNTTGKLDRKALMHLFDTSFQLDAHKSVGNEEVQQEISMITNEIEEDSFAQSSIEQFIRKTYFDVLPSLAIAMTTKQSSPNRHFLVDGDIGGYDFYSLGGNSLSAVEVLWLLRRHYKVPFPASLLSLKIKDVAAKIAKLVKEEKKQLTTTRKKGTVQLEDTKMEDEIEDDDDEVDGAIECEEDEASQVPNSVDFVGSEIANDEKTGSEDAPMFAAHSSVTTAKSSQGGMNKRTRDRTGRAFLERPVAVAVDAFAVLDTDSPQSDDCSTSSVVDKKKVRRQKTRRRLAAPHINFLPSSSEASLGSDEVVMIVSRTLRRLPAGAGSTVSDANRTVVDCGIAAVELKPLWACKLTRCVDASPLILGLPGAEYVAGLNDVTSATSAANNEVLANRTNDSSSCSSGQRKGQVEIVFIGSHDGDFLAVDLPSGRVIWQLNLGNHIEASASSDDCGRTVFVCTFNGDDVDGPRTNESDMTRSLERGSSDEGDRGSVVYASDDEGGEDSGIEGGREGIIRSQNTSSPLEKKKKSSILHTPTNRGDGEDDDLGGTDESLRAVDKSLGTLWAIDVATGSVIWTTQFAGEIKSSAVYDSRRGCLYVGAYDGRLYAIEAFSGKKMHSVDCGGSIYANPLLLESGDDILVATTQGLLSCYTIITASHADPIGAKQVLVDIDSSRPKKTLSFGHFSLRWSHDAKSPIFSTPTVDSVEGRILIGVVDGSLRCLSQQGQELWRVNATKPVFTSPLILPASPPPTWVAHTTVAVAGSDAIGEVVSESARVIFGSHDGNLRCVSLETGMVAWTSDLGSVLFASPCAAPRPLRYVIAANTAGEILLVDECTGRVAAKTRIAGEVYSSPIILGDTVVVGGRDDRLHAFKLVAT